MTIQQSLQRRAKATYDVFMLICCFFLVLTTTTTAKTTTSVTTFPNSVQQRISSSSYSTRSLIYLRGGATTTTGNYHNKFSFYLRKNKRLTSTPSSTTTPSIPDGTATVSAEIFNLIKSIVGAGVLGLPAGVAAFGNSPSAIIPAMVLLVFIGSLAANGFDQIGQVCKYTHSTSYKQAWSNTVSKSTSWMPALACLMVTACTVLTYSMILADTIPSILPIPNIQRTTALLVTTVFVLLPLCLLKQLSSLAPFSLIGIFGMLYTALCMMWRWVTGAYDVGGPLLKELAKEYHPSFGTDGWESVFSSNAAILVSMLATAYMAHYNAPKFYWELQDRKQYKNVVWLSFIGAMTITSITMISGFVTFGTNSNSLILNNYSSNDILMKFSRIAVTLSLIFSYPLAFLGVRDNVFSLLQIPTSKQTNKVNDTLTVLLLSIITVMAIFLTDIRVILSLGGATWGNLLVYVFPSIMMIRAAKPFPHLKSQVPISYFTGILGICMGIVGTIRALS